MQALHLKVQAPTCESGSFRESKRSKVVSGTPIAFRLASSPEAGLVSRGISLSEGVSKTMNSPARKLLLAVLPVFILLWSPVPAAATSVVMLSDTELVVNARFIVTGKVRSVISAWDDAHSEAWTYVKVRVDSVLKGELATRTVVLKQLGGEAGGSGMRVLGQPEFSKGQHVLLYLNTGPDGTLRVAYAFMGMFSISEDESGGQSFVTRAIDGREVDILPRPDNDAVTNRARLDHYIENIQQTLIAEASRIAVIDSERSADVVVPVPPEYARKKEEDRGVSADFVLMSDGVRWRQPDSGQPVTYRLNSNLSPVSGGGTAEITRALEAWFMQSGANIRLQLAGQTSSCGFVTDGVNTISFGDCLGQIGPPVGSCSGVVAQTRIVWNTETSVVNGRTFKRLLEADVVFNVGMNCFLGVSANLAETACHELGHSIGLAHSTDTAAIMWASVRGQGRDATLGNDDKAGVLAIYPGTGGVGGGAVSITSDALPRGVVNHTYRQTLNATGGAPPYRWTLTGGTLPPGIGVSAAGVIEGTPTAAGFFSFMLMVTDSIGGPNRTTTKQFSLSIDNDNGGFALPVITRVKVKKTKKLWLFGENLEPDSMISLNGVLLTPKEFTVEGSIGKLFFKGQLPLQPPGGNVVFVRNTSGWSAGKVF